MRLRRDIFIVMLFVHSASFADELLHRYEGDVHVLDKSTGWFGGGCDGHCTASLQDGHFVLTFKGGGEIVTYRFDISNGINELPQPDTLWVEWSLRSDQVFNPFLVNPDASFKVRYKTISELVDMYGDAVFSFEGGGFRAGSGCQRIPHLPL